MFQQGSGGSITEFHELRTYLIAKLLWNPDVDVDAVRKDFLDGYYGAGGPFIEKYIQKLHDSLVASGTKLDIYGYPFDAINSYLTPELMKEYEAIFDKAEKAVANDTEILKRVKRARLPVEFAILDIALHNVNDELSFICRKNGNVSPKKDMLNQLDAFVGGCEENGIERIEEHGYSPQQFKANVYKYVEKAGRPNLAFAKPVEVKTKWSEKYSAGGGTALTDGKFGLTDYHYNWLGFENANLEAVIDLGEPKEISELSADFLQHPLDWVFLPKWVDFAVSNDGTNFKRVAHLTHDIPQTKGKIFLHTFKTKDKTSARYIKISAESLKLCPPWHRGAGQPAWIFVDEVIVN